MEEMGPERVLPNADDELSQDRPALGGGDWSGEEEAEGEDGGGYYYQPLNQDPDGPGGAEPAEEVGCLQEQLQEVQERLEAMGLHLPQAPPPDTDEEEEPEGAVSQHSHASIPMDAEHVELVKRTMATVALPAPPPIWAQELSEAQWQDMVEHTLYTHQSAAALRLARKAPDL